MGLIAVDQFSDRPFARSDLTGELAEVVGCHLQVGREVLEILDDDANVLAVVADRSADVVRGRFDRLDDSRKLGAQIVGDGSEVLDGQ